jgi:hypothetical protein
MTSVIKQFDPAEYGRWKGSGMCWDLLTGEAINIEENVILLNGGHLGPSGNIIGGNTPGEANQVTVGVRTDYFFRLGVQVDLGQGLIDVEPWGWAMRPTTIKVYDLLKPYVEAKGGTLTGIDAREVNDKFHYTYLQDHIFMEFDGSKLEIPAGAIAQMLASKVYYNWQTDEINEGTGRDSVLTMLAEDYARAAKAAAY